MILRLTFASTIAAALLVAEAPAAEVVRPVNIFRGIIEVDEGAPDDGEGPDYPIVEILRSEQDFERFRGRLPAEQVSRVRPAPENDDPLRSGPPTDFSDHFAVAIVTNQLEPMTVAEIGLEGDMLTFSVSSPAELGARPIGTGSYMLLVFPELRRGLKVVLDERQEADGGASLEPVAAGEKLAEILKEAGDDAARRALSFAKANALSQHPSPAAWQHLIEVGLLVDGMSYAEAVAVLGHAWGMPRRRGTQLRELRWHAGSGGETGEGRQVLKVSREEDGSLSGWSVEVSRR